MSRRMPHCRRRSCRGRNPLSLLGPSPGARRPQCVSHRANYFYPSASGFLGSGERRQVDANSCDRIFAFTIYLQRAALLQRPNFCVADPDISARTYVAEII
jgi:hypothetical protein